MSYVIVGIVSALAGFVLAYLIIDLIIDDQIDDDDCDDWSAYDPSETDRLYEILKKARERGVARANVIYFPTDLRG